ncbi:zinc finger protein 11-like, partial [Anoplophora glabripennis]|uniref:zinc finger protein 11-like n=1 Tax=Anoplophora glabripennis TaxID=217634 RepID=UPI000C75AF87
MSDVQEPLCRLCIKTITDNSFEIIDIATRDILHVLLLKLKCDGESKDVICNTCRKKLNSALEFKSACLNTDNTIIPYVDCKKMLELDMREMYMRENGKKIMNISDSQKICRLCMQPVSSEFRCIREEELEAIEKLAPEMIINMVKDPVVCKPCFDSLCTHNNFLRDCLEVEEKISSAMESPADTAQSDLFIKTECLDKELDINEAELSIKDECVDIKSEVEEKSDTSPQSSDNEPFAKVQMYRCNDCDYKTKHKNAIKQHQLKHNDPSQVKMYRCNDCSYETKYKSDVTKHELTHKGPSQVLMYRCNDCSYETKYKGNMKKHELTHKDPSQVQMYRCNVCDYESRHKYVIKRHQLKHKDPSQIQMFKCNECDYEAKYRGYIKRHQLKHKDSSQVQMYRCNDCNYETVYMRDINRHQLTHKDPSQVQMYRCNNCDYETKYKKNIIQLCLNTVRDSNRQVIDEVIKRDVLKIVLPGVNLEENKHFMCTTCSVKLFAAFNFKSICMETEDIIFPHVNASKMPLIDLKEVYLKEKGNSQLIDISEDHRICRLCFQSVTFGFLALNEVDVDIIHACIPQLNVSATRDPVICRTCFDSLRTHGSFLKSCLEVHETYTNGDEQFYIKTEEIEIKLEDDQDGDTPLQTYDNEPFEKSDCKDAEDDACRAENSATNTCNVKIKQEPKVSDECIYETGCESCFTSQRKHKNLSQAQTYKCNDCDYETKYKRDFERHQLKHKDPSQLQMYKCDKCDYETIYRSYIKNHQQKHNDPSQIQMYRCNDCDYKTIYRNDIKKHQQKHRDPAHIQTYKCNDCDYETKYKSAIKKHQLTHKDPSQIQMHACNDCSYKTKYKDNIKKHQLKHKDPSHIEMYRCNVCDYETKYKSAIKQHQLKHKDPSQKFDDESKEVICNACRKKLYAAFEFKSRCLNTDNTIISHVDCEKMLKLDIREVYRKEKGSKSISDSEKICRLCMNLVKSEIMCIREGELEAIQKLTPEMNINIIEDPVICQECFDSLCTHNSFLRECLEVEEKIRGAYDNSATESRIDTSPSDLFVTTENLDKDLDMSEMEFSIKTECVDIKSEDEERSDAPLQTSNNEPSEKSDCKDAEEDRCKNENGSENKCNKKAKRECKVLYKCDKPIYQTGCKSHFTMHCARHKNNSEGYKCES